MQTTETADLTAPNISLSILQLNTDVSVCEKKTTFNFNGLLEK